MIRIQAVVVLAIAFGAWAAAALAGRSPTSPPRIEPLLRPALPGEGVWRVVVHPIRGRPPLLITTFRSDRSNPSVTAYVAWIDPTRAQVALYPGADQPQIAIPRGPAEIPFRERWRLLATFNGGFKYGSHSGGGGGFAVNGHTYVPLERGLGTLVGYRDGHVDVAAWEGGATAPRQVAFARQNLHLLVDKRRPAADLGNQAVWGWTLGGGQAVWRTAVGIDRRGDLIYVAVDDTAANLAETLIRAGAIRAVELDINPEWATFDLYDHRAGLHARQFVPNLQQRPNRYLTPDKRDFFAVYRRVPGENTLVPFG